MADAPAVTASPETHLKVADAAKVTSHPIRKFKETLLVVVTFWPLWIVLLLVGIGFAVLERAGKGVVTGLLPGIGAWARRKAVGAPAATTTTTTTTTAPIEAAPAPGGYGGEATPF